MQRPGSPHQPRSRSVTQMRSKTRRQFVRHWRSVALKSLKPLRHGIGSSRLIFAGIKESCATWVACKPRTLYDGAEMKRISAEVFIQLSQDKCLWSQCSLLLLSAQTQFQVILGLQGGDIFKCRMPADRKVDLEPSLWRPEKRLVSAWFTSSHRVQSLDLSPAPCGGNFFFDPPLVLDSGVSSSENEVWYSEQSHFEGEGDQCCRYSGSAFMAGVSVSLIAPENNGA
jgi:hypothetical protein